MSYRSFSSPDRNQLWILLWIGTSCGFCVKNLSLGMYEICICVCILVYCVRNPGNEDVNARMFLIGRKIDPVFTGWFNIMDEMAAFNMIYKSVMMWDDRLSTGPYLWHHILLRFQLVVVMSSLPLINCTLFSLSVNPLIIISLTLQWKTSIHFLQIRFYLRWNIFIFLR